MKRIIPFAIAPDGTIIDSNGVYDYIDIKNPHASLFICPVCNQYIRVIRTTSGNNITSWYFAHYNDNNHVNTCKGVSKNSLHEVCKNILEHSIGKTITIPAVRNIDLEPHVSSFTKSGRKTRSNFDYHGFNQTRDYDSDDKDIYDYWDNHDSIFSGKIERPVRKATILKAKPEHLFTFGMKADEYITVQYEDNNKTQNIAYEIRYSHPKSKQDMDTYAKNNINVLECNIVMPSAMTDIDNLTNRLLGETNMNDNMPYLEWLYNRND